MLILFRNIELSYRGSLVYLVTIICYFLTLLHNACGQLAVWGTLTPKTSQQEVATNSQIN